MHRYLQPEGLKFWKEGAVHLQKGQQLGRFNLGSTIVLLLELPKDSQVHVEAMQKVKYGQPIATTRPASA